jgi:hypothetical protein
VDALTAPDIRAISKVNFGRRGYAEGEDPDPLDSPLAAAAAYVMSVTGFISGVGSNVPSSIEPLVRDAIVMRVEQLVVQRTDANAATAGDFDMIASFTAGDYSETRRDAARAGAAAPAMGSINSWPALNDLLWLLLGTGETLGIDAVIARWNYWRSLFGGTSAPAWNAIEVDWNRAWYTDGGYHNTLPGDVFPLAG